MHGMLCDAVPVYLTVQGLVETTHLLHH